MSLLLLLREDKWIDRRREEKRKRKKRARERDYYCLALGPGDVGGVGIEWHSAGVCLLGDVVCALARCCC